MADLESLELNLRRARLEDVSEILRLLYEDELGAKREVFVSPVPQSYLDAFALIDQDPRTELIVAELRGQIVGTLQMTFIQGLSFQGAKVAQVESVRISENLRGKGLGQIMMKWAFERARKAGCFRIQLSTNKIRKDAHRFYERLGFSASHLGMKLEFQ